MQQDNNMDNKLQQLENQRLPDLSHMDEHWINMETMLQDSHKPAGGVFSLAGRRLLGWVAAVAVLVALFFGGRYYLNRNDGNDTVAINNTAPSKNNIIISDSSKKDSVSSNIQPSNNSAIQPFSKTTIQQSAISFSRHYIPKRNSNVTINFYPCDSSGALSSDHLPDSIKQAYAQKETEAMNAYMLSEFWGRMEKQIQQFTIDNRFDTMLVCTEGTRLRIPAGAFSGSNDKISIEVKEFYTYQDMIANKLSTTSNGQQLVSDGMLSVKAIRNGKEVDLTGLKPMEIVMPRRDSSEEMQLFTGQQFGPSLMISPGVDTVNVAGAGSGNINWIPAGRFQGMPKKRYLVKSFDPYGQPYKVRENANGVSIAKFVIKRNCTLSNEKALEGLRGHFEMFYNRIKLKRSWSNRPHKLFSKQALPFVGDSVLMDYQSAKALKLATPEELARVEAQMRKDTADYEKGLKGMASYQFTVSKLGYINCDRFQNTPGERIEFTFDLGNDKNVSNFTTVLAFQKYRSVLNGVIAGGRVLFQKVPKNSKVYLISVGAKDGKIYSCIQPYMAENKIVSDLPFEETSPEQFKKKIAALDF